MQEFQSQMQKAKEIDEDAWKYLDDILPCLWTRAAFSTFSKNDVIVNNMSESFNGKILQIRGKPIISVLEDLRADVMDRHIRLRINMERREGKLMPEVRDRLIKEFKKSIFWTAKWSGDSEQSVFQVSKKTEQYIVNVNQASCTCRRWDLSGIPCTHAVAAIGWLHKDPSDYVLQAYTRETYLRVYQHNMEPTNGENLWVATGGDTIIPPPMNIVVGRPTKKRRREHDEPKSSSRLRRMYPKIKCGKCGGLGHNKRGCKNPLQSQASNMNVNVEDESVAGRGAAVSRGGRRGAHTESAAGGVDTNRVAGSSTLRSKMPVKRPLMQGGGSRGGSGVSESIPVPIEVTFDHSSTPGKRTKSSARRMPNIVSTIQHATSSARYNAMLNATQESVANARK
ncbi:uncharacterized protein LOC119980639 [Tripterygium wilfordii]|uniref:uncharacterized protein LOC119980639 n=1 Tax=Tripterygium wilfordii TaxID=458696 RepID=UPI0018F83A04|nr:uncharacterized protein LOC119980639 [Tripterygium wilfordii]XP_038679356.1 uncharacterized protein LOC119980639 [Tripterygium wilfordii]XP_038679357.1 uncharacterized protein LOC119980639 [Tripterygium wilfordii]XP_038679358.1 uncharacterized protein LOC119980639 [Tripterygium wilfordii]